LNESKRSSLLQIVAPCSLTDVGRKSTPDNKDPLVRIVLLLLLLAIELSVNERQLKSDVAGKICASKQGKGA
jgi:hypothetical protein